MLDCYQDSRLMPTSVQGHCSLLTSALEYVQFTSCLCNQCSIAPALRDRFPRRFLHNSHIQLETLLAVRQIGQKDTLTKMCFLKGLNFLVLTSLVCAVRMRSVGSFSHINSLSWSGDRVSPRTALDMRHHRTPEIWTITTSFNSKLSATVLPDLSVNGARQVAHLPSPFTMSCPLQSAGSSEVPFDRCPAALDILFGRERCMGQCSCTFDGYMTCTADGIPAECHATPSDVVDFCLSYGDGYPACRCGVTSRESSNAAIVESAVEDQSEANTELKNATGHNSTSQPIERQHAANISSTNTHMANGGLFELTCAGPGVGYIGFIQTCPTVPETVEPLTGNKCTTWCECDNSPGTTRGQIVCPRAEGRGGLCGGGSGYGYTETTENFCRAGTRSFQCQCLIRYRDAVEV